MNDSFFYEIKGKNSDGPIVLITAGVDGDEYAGIESAYHLAQELKEDSFSGTIRIVPVVNIHGFESGVSWNPIDKKFPKHIFPGNPRGSDSEKLIFNLWRTVGEGVSLWIDLHGGARNEKLNPYILGSLTGDTRIDSTMKEYLRAISYPRMIIDSVEKVKQIAKKKCVYLMFESGDRGLVDPSCVAIHKEWVKTVLKTIENNSQQDKNILRYYSKEIFFTSPGDGLFRPRALGSDVASGEPIGYLSSLSKNETKPVLSPCSGIVLYHRTYSWVKKGDDLITIAFEPIEE